jgi:16S rRNA (cytosine967-C5)-methyltransferase
MLHTQVTAARVLARVLAGKNLNETLGRAFDAASGLTPQQQGAIREACYDALRHYGLIRAQLRELMKNPATPPELEALLIVALAQLQFGRAKEYAIVDHAVRATETLGVAKAKSLVNAVLRNWQRKKDDLGKRVLAQPEARYNLPSWWLDKITAQYPGEWQGMAACAQKHPPLTLRVNTRHVQVRDQKARLEAARFEVMPLGPVALAITPPRPVGEIPGFAEGDVSVQDAGAQHAAFCLDARDGMRVLDACAAPGGKTGHVLERSDVELVALDSDAQRVRRIESNLMRLGLKADVRTADANAVGNWWDGKPFERILLDVPCSGSGVIRRHPDIKWLRRPGDLPQFAETQSALLESLWNCLSKGGRLLYATCSVFEEENEGVVDAFVARSQETGQPARRMTLPAASEDCAQPQIINGQLLPDDHHDGFFYALLEKI